MDSSCSGRKSKRDCGKPDRIKKIQRQKKGCPLIPDKVVSTTLNHPEALDSPFVIFHRNAFQGTRLELELAKLFAHEFNILLCLNCKVSDTLRCCTDFLCTCSHFIHTSKDD